MASLNPVSVLVAAVRILFGNPVTPPHEGHLADGHPVPAALLYTAAVLVIGVTASTRRYQRRTIG